MTPVATGAPADERVPDQVPFAPVHGTGRSLAVDVFRGLVVGWLVVLVHTPTLGLRGHAAWWGFDHSDVFFPAFLFVAGAGLALQTRDRPMPWPRLVRRFLVLFVLGLFVNAWLAGGADVSTLRVPGVLQRIAVVGLLGAAVVAGLRRSWRLVLAAAGVVALAWSLALAGSASACPGGEPAMDGCGTFLWLDTAVLGDAHVYRGATAGHDPEGIASTAGALATFLVGYAAARWRPAPRGHLLHAAGWLVATPLLVALAPVGKRLWTGAFVAVTAAGCLLLLAVLVTVLDRRRSPRLETLTWPIVALGRNALVVWTGVFLLQGVLARTEVDGLSLSSWFATSHGGVAYFLAFGLPWFALAWAMHAARWHVRL